MVVKQPVSPLNMPAYGLDVPARAYHGSFAQSRRNLCAQSRDAIGNATIPQSTPQYAIHITGLPHAPRKPWDRNERATGHCDSITQYCSNCLSTFPVKSVKDSRCPTFPSKFTQRTFVRVNLDTNALWGLGCISLRYHTVTTFLGGKHNAFKFKLHTT